MKRFLVDFSAIVLTTMLSHLTLAQSYSRAVSDTPAKSDPETLVISFQKQKNPQEVQKTAEEVASFLSREIGKKVEVVIPTSYGATAQAFISGRLHLGYMDSLPYILAGAEADLEILAVEKRNGRQDYDSLFVVKKDSPLQSLKDLKGKKIAFTSQTSTSGYLFPYSRLIDEKIIASPDDLKSFFSEIVYAGGYDKALQAVVRGQVDVAAFSDYVIEGKKADLYGDLETRQQVRVLARTAGVPTHLIAVQKNLSPLLKDKIKKALLKLSKEQPHTLASVYGAAELVQVKKDGEHVFKTQQALKKTGLEAKVFVK